MRRNLFIVIIFFLISLALAFLTDYLLSIHVSFAFISAALMGGTYTIALAGLFYMASNKKLPKDLDSILDNPGYYRLYKMLIMVTILIVWIKWLFKNE